MRKGGFFRFLLLVIDIALAVWIWNSYKDTQAETYVPPQPVHSQEQPAHTADVRTQEPPVPDTVPEGDHEEFPPEEDYDSYPTEDDYGQFPSPDTESGEYSSETVIDLPPEVDHFSWYLDGVMLHDVPDGSAGITDYSLLPGSWECMVYRDPEGSAQKEQLIFFSAMIDIGQNGMVLVLDRVKDLDLRTGELNEYQNLESDVYGLSMEDDFLRIDWDGGAAIYIYVYEYNGRQYGIGVFESESGLMFRAAAFQK